LSIRARSIPGSQANDAPLTAQSDETPQRDALYLAALFALSLVAYRAPWAVVYVPAALGLALLTLLRLDLALLLVPFYLPFFPASKHIGRLEFSPSELLILLDAVALVALILSRRLRPDWARLARTPFLPPAALLAAAALVSTLLAADRHVAAEWFRWTIAEPLLYFFMLLIALRSERRWWYLTVSAVLGGAVSAAIAIGQSLTATSGTALPVVQVRLQQARGVYGSPDNLGLLYDRIVPLWLALMLATSSLVRRVFWGLVGAVLLLALLLAYSRGAWLALAIGVLLFVAWALPWGKWLALGALLGALLLGVAAGPRIARALTSGHSGTASMRLIIWNAAARMIRDHPVFGVGPDNFQHYYAPTRKQDRWQNECAPGVGYVGNNDQGQPCFSHPHNEFLDFWLSTGIAGLAAFIWIQVVFWRQAMAGIRARDVLTLGASAAMVAALVHGLVDNSYFLPDLAVLFWILCALVSRTPVRWRR
jgi:putative inorganic carbon (hco3(-)) transporter